MLCDKSWKFQLFLLEIHIIPHHCVDIAGIIVTFFLFALEISSAEMQSLRTDPLEQTESPRPDPPIQMELPRPCFPKQTARKSIPRPREPKVKKVTRKQATLKTIRRKCIKQMERRRIATIKVALIRQQFGATRHQYDATPDNNFPIYSACSTPDSLSVSPAGIDRLLASPDAADQSQPSTSQSSDLSNQSTLTISNNSKSRSKSDDCDSQLNTVPANVSNLSHHPFKDSPVTTQSYSEVAVSKVVSTRAEEKGRPQESLWSSLEFNSAKERAQAKLTPSKSVPLKKRKFSLDNHQTATLVGKLPHQFSPAQMQSTAMLKQLKPRAPPQNPTSSSCSSTQHKVLFHSKSVPGTASIEQERPKLKQTARKTTKPCRASPYLSTTGSPRAVEEYLNSSENKKFLIESKREPGSTHWSPPLKRNLSFKSISKKSSPLHFPIAASSNTNSSTKTIEPNVATSASSLQTFLASDPSPEEREKNLKKSSGRKSISKPYSRLTGEKPRSLNLD